ncbi:MAG TPA: hypothetical protein VMF51_16170 [Nocardioides sp.]|jgi:hypothetical protein|uniref:hypothetical protein n=1 Tax=Nocardioides sp. TaxID=35761 RepID=UPI002C0FA9EC|nr:hypothetical protein [Nocardioides sp.]HTW16672.1 hypothetical protein [Nocardioides sp.]
MFAHRCTSCTQRQLIFPSQVTSLVNTDHGIIVAFTCWCGADQTMLTGKNAGTPAGEPAAVPTEVREDATVAA